VVALTALYRLSQVQIAKASNVWVASSTAFNGIKPGIFLSLSSLLVHLYRYISFHAISGKNNNNNNVAYPLAAYRAIKPKMKGKEIPAKPAKAMGSFSSSVILSVFLLYERKIRLVHRNETRKRKYDSSSLVCSDKDQTPSPSPPAPPPTLTRSYVWK